MLRLNPIVAAAPAGLATGLLAWFLAGGGQGEAERLSELEMRLAALPGRVAANAAPVSITPVAGLVASPLFLMTVGPGAVSEPSVRVEGVSVSRRRSAALLSIGDAPAEWMVVGDTRGGVTLLQVGSGGAVVETVLGSKDVALGERAAGSGAASASPPPAVGPASAAVLGVSGADTIPPGFRSPPAPASAPGVTR